MYYIDCKLFITNNVVVLHLAQAYWVTNSFYMNFLNLFWQIWTVGVVVCVLVHNHYHQEAMS